MVSRVSSAIGGMPASATIPRAPEFLPERPSLYECNACGQMIDRRHLGEVLHHEVPNHRPLPSTIP